MASQPAQQMTEGLGIYRQYTYALKFSCCVRICTAPVSLPRRVWRRYFCTDPVRGVATRGGSQPSYAAQEQGEGRVSVQTRSVRRRVTQEWAIVGLRIVGARKHSLTGDRRVERGGLGVLAEKARSHFILRVAFAASIASTGHEGGCSMSAHRKLTEDMFHNSELTTWFPLGTVVPFAAVPLLTEPGCLVRFEQESCAQTQSDAELSCS